MLVLSACEKIKFLSQNNSKKNLKTDTVKSVSVWLMSLDLVEHGSVASVRNKKPPALRVVMILSCIF